MHKNLCILIFLRIFASEKETNNKLTPKTRKGNKIMAQKTMKQIRQRIYIETSKHKPEQIVLIFAQRLCMGGYREEGRKVLPFDAHAVTDFIESHGNETANIIKTDSYVTEGDWKETYEMTVEVEKCNYKLF